MRELTELDSETFVLYAYRHYNNPQCVGGLDEFHNDLHAFKYIKKLVNRYQITGELSYRLILNHVILIYNVFGVEASNMMMEYKMENDHWPVIKPFLIYLNYITTSDYIEIPMDEAVIAALRSI